MGSRRAGPVQIRKYEPYPVFRKYKPKASDRHYESAMEGQIPQEPVDETLLERNFDAVNYSADDHGFWDEFEKLWTDSPGEKWDNSIKPDPSWAAAAPDRGQQRAARSVLEEEAVEQATKGSWKAGRPNILHSQRAHLKRTCDPADLSGELRTFRKWKKSLDRCWTMLSQERLPRKTAEIRRLKWLLGHEHVEAMRGAWEGLPRERRQRIWPHVMMSALLSHPDQAHAVFRATFDASLVLTYMAQDTIHYLVRQRTASRPAGGYLSSPDELFGTVQLVLENSPAGYLRLRQRTVYLLIHQLDSEKLAGLYRLLGRQEQGLHHFTQLQLASRLAKDPAYKELSVDILRSTLQTTKLDINTPQGASLCTSILSLKEEDLAGELVSVTPAELLEQLLDCGLRPNLIIYTALIRNLCLTRDLETAWEVFRLMVRQGIQPDAHVYSVLWNASKCGRDFASLGRVVDQMVEAKVAHRSPVLWTDFLHGISHSAASEAEGKHSQGTGVNPAFTLMARAYARLFAMGPLRSLVPDVDCIVAAASEEQADTWQGWRFYSHFAPMVQALPRLAPGEPMEPLAETLAVMLIGYMRAMSNPYDIMAFYAHFRKLLGEGHRTAALLVRKQSTLVHDIVIKRLCEWPGMLRVALDVTSDMLKDASACSDDGRRPKHPAPSVYTWSVLLNGFMHQRETTQAEKLLHMMRNRGVAPNIVTWNTLVAGYARLQNVRETAGAMQRLEQAGLAADDFTFRAFGYLHDKEAALSHMEGIIEERRQRLQQQQETMARTQQQEKASGEKEGELQRLVSEVDEIARSMGDEHGEAAETPFGEDSDDALDEMSDEMSDERGA